ncbi:M48 family metallopeptidase [Streptomyces sparsogenes]|uniref:M48 family metallopeptidase n=1 Tax=Streptomyces sparsogenes TaxID=67365 RepID=UPI000825112C|nr:M48 family metallopeptidase [Streptomyces sparsogenes]
MITAAVAAARAVLALVLLAVFYVLVALLVLLWLAFLVLGLWSAGMPESTAPPTSVIVACAAFAPIVGGMVWAVARTARPAAPPEDTVWVSRRRAPALWAAVEELAAGVGTAPPDAIRLTTEVNASVTEDATFLGLMSGRRTLYLGLPLMVGLPPAELRAVLAHELGHFSRRHSRFGALAHRGTVGLAAAREAINSAAAANNLVRTYAGGPLLLLRGYTLLFRRLTRPVRRRQEIEADREAARVAGARTVADALCSAAALEVAWLEFVGGFLTPVRRAEGRVPDDPFRVFAHMVEAPELREPLAALRARATERPADRDDPHPDLATRLSRLARLPDQPPPAGADRFAEPLDVPSGYARALGRTLHPGGRTAASVPWREWLRLLAEHRATRLLRPLAEAVRTVEEAAGRPGDGPGSLPGEPLGEPPAKPPAKPPGSLPGKPLGEPPAKPPAKPPGSLPGKPLGEPPAKPPAKPPGSLPGKPLGEPPAKPPAKPPGSLPGKPLGEPPAKPPAKPPGSLPGKPLGEPPAKPPAKPPGSLPGKPLGEPPAKPPAKPPGSLPGKPLGEPPAKPPAKPPGSLPGKPLGEPPAKPPAKPPGSLPGKPLGEPPAKPPAKPPGSLPGKPLGEPPGSPPGEQPGPMPGLPGSLPGEMSVQRVLRLLDSGRRMPLARALGSRVPPAEGAAPAGRDPLGLLAEALYVLIGAHLVARGSAHWTMHWTGPGTLVPPEGIAPETIRDWADAAVRLPGQTQRLRLHLAALGLDERAPLPGFTGAAGAGARERAPKWAPERAEQTGAWPSRPQIRITPGVDAPARRRISGIQVLALTVLLGLTAVTWLLWANREERPYPGTGWQRVNPTSTYDPAGGTSAGLPGGGTSAGLPDGGTSAGLPDGGLSDGGLSNGGLPGGGLPDGGVSGGGVSGGVSPWPDPTPSYRLPTAPEWTLSPSLGPSFHTRPLVPRLTP